MIKIAFYKGEGRIFDKLIRWWTKGKYSHCEIVFMDGLWYGADAWNNEVRYAYFLPDPANWDMIEISLAPKEELLVRAWCDSKVGKGYDYLGLILSQVIFLGIDCANRWFCSELCVEALQQAGRLKDIKSHTIHPSLLAKIYGLA